MPAGTGERDVGTPNRISPQLSFRHAFGILVSIQIGSGIFASPSLVDTNVPSPFAALAVWAFSGALAWAGAASFAELGTMLPRQGGMQEYLRYIFGDVVSSTMAWIWILVVKPSSMAMQGFVLGESLGLVFGTSETLISATTLVRIIALVVIFIIFILNIQGTKTSARASEIFTAFKLTTAAGLALGGLYVALSQQFSQHSCENADWCSKSWFEYRKPASGTSRLDWTQVTWGPMIGHYLSAILAGLWAYSGWDNSSYIAAELIDVRRNLPKTVHLSMAAVMVSLEIVNISYYILLPWLDIGSSKTVAVVAVLTNFGSAVAAITSVLVSISCAGAINGQMFAGSRLIASSANRGYLPSIFGSLSLPFSFTQVLQAARDWIKYTGRLFRTAESPVSQIASSQDDTRSTESLLGNPSPPKNCPNSVPALAMLLNAIIAGFYVLVGDFSFLLTLSGMAIWSFLFLTVLGLMILRRREPNLNRPYRVPLLIPGIFCSVALAMILSLAIFAPVQAMVLLAVCTMRFLIGLIRHRIAF